jgi:hypothetical protein
MGEHINVQQEATAVNFAEQPPHVKLYKLDRKFGQRAPIGSMLPCHHNPLNANDYLFPFAGKKSKYLEDDDEATLEEKKKKRLQAFFGERFNVEQILNEEKMKSALTDPSAYFTQQETEDKASKVPNKPPPPRPGLQSKTLPTRRNTFQPLSSAMLSSSTAPAATTMPSKPPAKPSTIKKKFQAKTTKPLLQRSLEQIEEEQLQKMIERQLERELSPLKQSPPDFPPPPLHFPETIGVGPTWMKMMNPLLNPYI